MLDLRTLLETFDVSRAAAVASVFRKNHTWLCPTRVTGLALAGDPRLTQSPNLQYVGRKQRASWAKCAGDRDRRWNPCTQIGHRRRMTSVAALAQSASRLPWAGESEINSIVTVGGPARDVGLSQDPNSRAGPSPPEQKSRLEKNNVFRLAQLPLQRLAG